MTTQTRDHLYWTTKLGGAEFRVMRLNDQLPLAPSVMDTPESVSRFLHEAMRESLRCDTDVESFMVLHLNTRRQVTRDLIRGGQLLKIEVLDHVIIGKATPERAKDYASLRELGYFYA